MAIVYGIQFVDSNYDGAHAHERCYGTVTKSLIPNPALGI
jgi:hypothetical protein